MRLLFSGLLIGSWALSGCGSSGPACTASLTMGISPASGTADSSAKVPGNQVQFTAVAQETQPAGCHLPLPSLSQLLKPQWTASDTTHVKVSSAQDATNGLAICIGPTAGAATLTAVSGTGVSALTGTAHLTCN